MEENSASSQLEQTLTKPDIHHQWEQEWEQVFRTAANEAFYERVFDFLVSHMALPPDALVLDAGCGIGSHTVRLAKRGLQVTAVDFAPPVLDEAASHVAHQGVSDHVHIQRENLLALSLADGQFDCVLCWGVLMHISHIDTRESNIPRLIRATGAHDFTLMTRRAGHYGRSCNAFWQKIIHRLNQFWFETIQWPQPAFGNILILKKTARIAD